MDPYNGSHKADMTAYRAIRSAEKDAHRKGYDLARLLYQMADLAGFELLGRLRVRHRKTGLVVQMVRQRQRKD